MFIFHFCWQIGCLFNFRQYCLLLAPKHLSKRNHFLFNFRPYLMQTWFTMWLMNTTLKTGSYSTDSGKMVILINIFLFYN